MDPGLLLRDSEKKILDGHEGELKQRALELIVLYAKALDAPCLCWISKAHLYAGNHFYLQLKALKDLDVETTISKMHFCSDKKLPFDRVACFAQTDAGPMDPDHWANLGFSASEAHRNDEFLQLYLNAGIHLVGSCVPYLTGFIPLMGEHYVSTESHAVTLMNSIWGACANADGIEIAFCSAVSGYTPFWGNHVPDQRKATHIFQINFQASSIQDWDLLGYTIGQHAPSFCVPVLSGNFGRPDLDRLKACFSAMAASSGVELCHIEGCTPEALTLEQASGNVRMETIDIGAREISAAREHLGNFEGEVEFVSLGCPHYSIGQIKEAANLLEGRRVHPRVELQIWTAFPIKATSDRCGYTEIIEQAGGRLLCGSCPLLTGKFPENGNYGLLFDSAKQANYLRSKAVGKVFYGNMEECITASISGVFRPEQN